MLAPPLTAVTLRLAVSSQSIRIAIIAELLQVRGKVKTMRATFWGVNKSVINDNKKTVLDLATEYNVIMM